jgi:hypothetical protein
MNDDTTDESVAGPPSVAAEEQFGQRTWALSSDGSVRSGRADLELPRNDSCELPA